MGRCSGVGWGSGVGCRWGGGMGSGVVGVVCAEEITHTEYIFYCPRVRLTKIDVVKRGGIFLS